MKNLLYTVLIACGFWAALLASCKKSEYKLPGTISADSLKNASITVDTNIKFVDVSKYPQANAFPGLVCSTEPRIDSVISLSMNYNPVGQGMRINVPPRPQYCTGLYAAPGELVIVDVPEGMYSLTLQIGAWTDDFSSSVLAGLYVPRDPLIYTISALAPGRNYIRNLYGGHIYIRPNVPISNPVTLKFKNVCRSPDFILGQTNDANWQAAIRNSCVPFLEMRSNNFVMVVPRERCINYPIPSPTSLMTNWDKTIKEDYYGWTGLTENAVSDTDRVPLLPYFAVLDIWLPPGVGGHNGFPFVALNNVSWYSFFTNESYLLQSKTWGFHHELGHNFQQPRYWSWSTVGETTNNLFIYKTARRNELAGDPSAWPAKHDDPGAPGGFDNLGATFANAIAFASATGAKDFNGSDTRINSPFNRLTPFVQIFDGIPANWGYSGQPDGWGFMPFLYARARRAVRESGTDQAKQDFLYEAICDYTHKDWATFFKKWGINYSNTARDRVVAKGYPLLLQKIWEYNPITRTGGTGELTNVQAVQLVDPRYTPANWAIAGVSSEATNEGAGNVRAAILDGNLSSYWHTQWSPQAPFPHWITINFHPASSTLALPAYSGIQYAHRSGPSTDAKVIHIWVSDDNINWTELSGSPFALQHINGLQTINFGQTIQKQYIRLGVNSSAEVYSGVNLAIAEFAIQP